MPQRKTANCHGLEGFHTFTFGLQILDKMNALVKLSKRNILLAFCPYSQNFASLRQATCSDKHTLQHKQHKWNTIRRRVCIQNQEVIREGGQFQCFKTINYINRVGNFFLLRDNCFRQWTMNVRNYYVTLCLNYITEIFLT